MAHLGVAPLYLTFSMMCGSEGLMGCMWGRARTGFQCLMWLGTGQLSTALTCLQGSPLLQILMGKSLVPPTLHATCRTLTLDTKTLPGVTRIRRRYSEFR